MTAILQTKRIFMKANIAILIEISIKVVPKGPIDKKSASTEAMACRLFSIMPHYMN